MSHLPPRARRRVRGGQNHTSRIGKEISNVGCKMQPYSLNPETLRAELCLRGCPTSKRWILECVRKRLLPALSERGKGQGKGKVYFWDNPAIVEQAVAIFILRNLKYPTSVIRLSI